MTDDTTATGKQAEGRVLSRPFRAGLSILSVLCAGAALAESPPPPCFWNETTHTIVPADQADTIPGLFAPGIYPEVIAKDFVTWTIGPFTGDRDVPNAAVIQHCPTDQHLYLAFPAEPAPARDAYAEFNRMLTSTTGYTFRQMGEGLYAYGTGARILTGAMGRCACASVGLDN